MLYIYKYTVYIVYVLKKYLENAWNMWLTFSFFKKKTSASRHETIFPHATRARLYWMSRSSLNS